jgi:D-tyrosyl-tRNA(Tyr) deacylase
MRLVVQRVARARVTADDELVGAIDAGLLVLVGVERGDGDEQALRLAAKTARLRIFADEQGRFDRSVLDVRGGVLAVSQFTLLADTAKGNRPSFTRAADPADAEARYARYVEALRAEGVARVETGRFGASMAVELVNDGPVTIVLEAAPG